MQQLRFTIVGICPGKGSVRALLINESEVGIYPVPKVNPVRKIFSGSQNETLCAEKSRIDINLPFAIT